MQVGDKIVFGVYEWRVLDVKSDAVLIITEEIVEQRVYHDIYIDISWAKCSLREYLNGEFYHRFTEIDKLKIIPVKNKNPNNPWYDTPGGENTLDNIFLLTVEDVVCRYFGDSSINLYNRGKKQKYWFERKDENNSKRIAAFKGELWWYWLRSPGRVNVKAVYVKRDGVIGIQGNNILLSNIGGPFHSLGDNIGGVRPAMWLRI